MVTVIQLCKYPRFDVFTIQTGISFGTELHTNHEFLGVYILYVIMYSRLVVKTSRL